MLSDAGARALRFALRTVAAETEQLQRTARPGLPATLNRRAA
jgi:hypothetical protein